MCFFCSSIRWFQVLHHCHHDDGGLRGHVPNHVRWPVHGVTLYAVRHFCPWSAYRHHWQQFRRGELHAWQPAPGAQLSLADSAACVHWPERQERLLSDARAAVAQVFKEHAKYLVSYTPIICQCHSNFSLECAQCHAQACPRTAQTRNMWQNSRLHNCGRETSHWTIS